MPTGADAVAVAAQTYSAWLGEVEQLRFAQVPEPDSSPEVIREALLLSRANLDRLEAIYSLSMAQRGAFERKAQEMEDAADDAWAEIAAKAVQTGHGARDYEGSKERYARFDMLNIDRRRDARQWRQAAKVAGEADARIRLAYYGLQNVMQSLRDALRSFTLESSLDR